MGESEKIAIVIAGPTAVGKTAISIQLAQWLGTTIISADSRQCYREMRIGTAKPTSGELEQIPHFFINSHSVTDTLNAATFESLALNWLNTVFKDHAFALICGGTGLYIKALCEGLDAMPVVNMQVEADVLSSYRQFGIAWLQEQLKIHDPAFALKGEMRNPARMLRALSFVLSHGKSILTFRKGEPAPRPFHVLKIGLELPRQELYNRIDFRVDRMMEAGLLEEVKSLLPYRQYQSLNTVGYRELFDYLDGKFSLEVAVQQIKQHTRNYAKRQLTWFKKDPAFRWFHPEDLNSIKDWIETNTQLDRNEP